MTLAKKLACVQSNLIILNSACLPRNAFIFNWLMNVAGFFALNDVGKEYVKYVSQ